MMTSVTALTLCLVDDDFQSLLRSPFVLMVIIINSWSFTSLGGLITFSTSSYVRREESSLCNGCWFTNVNTCLLCMAYRRDYRSVPATSRE